MTNNEYPINDSIKQQILQCGILHWPPSDVIVLLGVPEDKQADFLHDFFYGAINSAYMQGVIAYKLRVESELFKAVGKQDKEKMDKVALDNLQALRAKNIEVYEREKRLYLANGKI